MNNEKEIPYGYCHCGCGDKTNITPGNDKNRGFIKGEPKKFILGHQIIKSRICPICGINKKRPKKCQDGYVSYCLPCKGCFNSRRRAKHIPIIREIKKVCRCGIAFITNDPMVKYCLRCRKLNSLKKKGITLIRLKTCQICNKEFIAMGNRRKDIKFCSHICYLYNRRGHTYTKITIKICNHCGNDFMQIGNKEKKYCSTKCRSKHLDTKSKRNRRIIQHRINVANLTDGYINQLFRQGTSLSITDIPKKVIELYRAKLKLVRMVRKTKLKGESYVECNGDSGSIVNSGEGVGNG